MSLFKKYAGRFPDKYHTPAFVISLFLILIAGIGLVLYATPYGPGLINDSVVYIGGAENILAGNGYSRTSGGGEIKPLTVNVPLYSYTLAAVAGTGVDLIKAGWLISLVCLAFNSLQVALITRRLTGSRRWAVIAALLMIVSDSVLRAHTFALSEPLFMTLMLASILILLIAMEQGDWYLPVMAGFLVSLTYLTRYIGLSLLATGLATFFLFPKTWKERITKIGLFLLSGLSGGVVWFIRNLLISGTAANRSFLYHPLTTDKMQEGAQTLTSFLLPERFDLYNRLPGIFNFIAIILIFVVIGLAFLFWRKASRAQGIMKPAYQGAFILALQAIFYFVVLLLSLTFLDASTALENRILVPVFVCLILLFVYLMYILWKKQTAGYQWVIGIMLVIVISGGAYDARRLAIDLHTDGQGYASAYYRNSLTIDALKRMPPTVIWTNRVPAVNLLADRPAYALLAPIDPLTRQKRPNYDSSLQGIRTTIMNGEAILVVFEARQVLDDPIEGQWLKELTEGIPAVFESDDGMIFAVQK